MTLTVQPPHAVLLVVGREQFAPPTSFGAAACVATADCVAVSVGDGPTSLELAPSPRTSGLRVLGEFTIESEGLVSVRDVYSREYDTLGVPAGLAAVTVWGDAAEEPGHVAVQVTPA